MCVCVWFVYLCNDKLQKCCLWQCELAQTQEQAHATKSILLLLSLPFTISHFSAAHVCVTVCEWLCVCVCACVWLFGARQLYCVKLMMRRFSSGFCLLLLLFFLLRLLLFLFFFYFFRFWFLLLLSSCNRNAQTEMSTKCRAKDVFINSPATWPRLNAILRTRTACPSVLCPSVPEPPVRLSAWAALAFLKAFCCCVSHKVLSMCISCCLAVSGWLCACVCL